MKEEMGALAKECEEEVSNRGREVLRWRVACDVCRACCFIPLALARLRAFALATAGLPRAFVTQNASPEHGERGAVMFNGERVSLNAS